jgi:hypothetical protein
MGMYTELVLKAEIEEDAPKQVHDVLNFLFNGAEEPKEKPEHDFFTKERWTMIGRCCSFYHTPFSLSKYSEGHIFSRSDLKNYNGEIEAFIDWLRPYINEFEGHCIGWTWYEEYDVPTLLIV